MKIRHPLRITSCVAIAAFALSANVLGAGRLWDGGGVNDFFSTNANWDTIAPGAADDARFGTDPSGRNTVGFLNDASVARIEFLPSAVAYTLQGNTGSEVLSLNPTLADVPSSIGLTNSSLNIRPVFQSVLIRASVNQTWDGGSKGFSIGSAELNDDQFTPTTVTLTGTGISAADRIQIAQFTGAGNIEFNGPGMLVIPGSPNASDYEGTLRLSGGTFQIGANNRLPGASTNLMILNGGTFSTGGFDDTVGRLSLTNNSFIDFETSNVSDLKFASSTGQNWGAFTLTITDFNTNQDTLQFLSAGLTQSQLGLINFDGVAATMDGAGFVTPVPEPSVFGFCLLSSIGLIGLRRRRI